MSTFISGPWSRSHIALNCFRKLEFEKPCNKRNISKTTTQVLPFSLLMLVLQSFRFNLLDNLNENIYRFQMRFLVTTNILHDVEFSLDTS